MGHEVVGSTFGVGMLVLCSWSVGRSWCKRNRRCWVWTAVGDVDVGTFGVGTVGFGALGWAQLVLEE